MARKKLTTSEVIQKFKEVHGNLYDYSLVDYKSAKSKVKIICRKHGVFTQTPSGHKTGKGCIQCAGKVKLTNKKIIHQFIKVHGSLYDYSLVDYVDNSTKVSIICREHGIFTQTPCKHKIGQGCPKCKFKRISKSKKTSHQETIEDFKKIHGDLYDYSLVDYIYSNIKVKIICKKHGIFMQSPADHKQGAGCKKCYYESLRGGGVWTTSKWIESANKSHNYKGFKIYLIICHNKSECFYKIGKTFMPIKKRLNKIPYYCKIIDTIKSEDGRYISNLEHEIHRKLRKYRYKPQKQFGGYTECYKLPSSPKSLSEIL